MQLIDKSGVRRVCERCHGVEGGVEFPKRGRACLDCRDRARLARLRREYRAALVYEAMQRAVREANEEIDRIYAHG